MNSVRVFAFACLCAFFFLPAEASEPLVVNENNNDEKNKKENSFISTRNFLGHSYLSLSRKIDDFLSGSFHETNQNESRLAIYTSNTWLEEGHSTADVKIKANVDLPNTAGRFRVFLESDPNETRTLEDRTRRISQGKDVEKESSVLGVEFSKPRPLSHWKTSVSLGARFRSGIKPLVRARARKYWQVTPNWQSYFRQDIWHLEGVGWGETSRIELTRKIAEKLRFEWMAELEYKDENAPWGYANTYQLFHALNDRYELVYRFGFLGDGPQSDMADNRFVNTSLNIRLYENWVFVDLTPEVFFAEEHNYAGDLSFTATFKVWFTD